MRKLFYILLLGTFFHSSRTAFAQTLNALWANAAGGTRSDQGRAIATDKSGNCVVVGTFQGTAVFDKTTLNSAGFDDIFIARFDAAGKLLWVKQAGGENSERGLAVTIDSAGNSVITGFFEGVAAFDDITLNSTGGTSDIFVAKYDAKGKVLWAKQAGELGSDTGNAVAVDEASNLIIIGSFDGTITFGNSTFESNGASDIFIAKYDAQGNVLWAKQAGGGNFDEGFGVATDAANDVVVTGYFGGNARFDDQELRSFTGEDDDIFIAKYAAAGKLMWARAAGGENFDLARAIATDKLDVILTGNFQDVAIFDTIRVTSSDFSEDIFIARYDQSGNALWAKSAGGAGVDDGLAIAVDGAGNSFITGYFGGEANFGNLTLTSAGITDIFIAKYDVAGNLREATKAGGVSEINEGTEDAGFGIATDGAGKVYAAGVFYATATFGQIRLSSAGADDIFIAQYGVVAPDISLNKASLDYGVVLIGKSAIDTLVASNIGNAVLNVSAIISGTNANEFAILSGSGTFDLSPGKSQNVLIRFAPTTAGNKSATLQLSTNDPDEKLINLALTGSANRPPVVANPIPNQTLTVGGAAFTRNLNAPPIVFTDPDQDALIYTVSSNATNIAAASISGSTLTVLPVAGGSATITVTANDNKGGTVATTFSVTVNRPPVVSNPIPNQILTIGGAAFTRNLNAAPIVFTDPDQDALTYTVSSNATNIAVASISGSTLTVLPVAGGSATITVTANDNKGGTVATTFSVTVNRPPVVSNPIPNQTLTVGGAAFTRNLNATPVVFTDPDQDALTYTTSSNATNIATTNISGSTLTLSPVAAGNATITVTANDNKGGTVSTTFTVNIVIGNRPPVVANAIPNQTLTVSGASFTRNLNATPVVFTDPDQDALTYTTSSNAPNIATTNISSTTLTVAPVAAGNATIIVTANDNKGGTVSTTFTVNVVIGNRAPVVANAIPNQTLTLGGASFSRNLNATPVVFTDPDQEALTYTASSNATNIATTNISGTTLTVAAVTAGSATITVTANDNKGGTAAMTFTVTVTRPAIPNPPSNLIVEAVSTRQINLQWLDNSATEDGFRLERRVGAVDTVITVGANVTRYQDTSLPPGAPASYQIRAFNAGGNSAATNAALATTATGLRGDVIPDFRLNAQDVSRVVNIIFHRAANVTRLDSAVADCAAEFPDGKINVIDVVYIVNGSLGSSLTAANEPARSSAANISGGELIVGPSSASIGGTVNLSVTIVAQAPVAAVQFKFRYDRRKITLGEPELVAQNSSLKIAAARAADQLAVLVYNLSAPLLPAGQQELLHIPLRLEAGNFSAADLQIENVLVVGEQGRVIPVLVRHEAVVLQTALPERFDLDQNYPNPFSLHAAAGNFATEIVYTLPVAAPVRLSIYNLVGQEIAVLVEAAQTAGIKKVRWNGRDQNGTAMISGVYFYRLHAGNFVATKKMLIMP